MKQKAFIAYGVIGIVIYLLATGVSYVGFRTFGKKEGAPTSSTAGGTLHTETTKPSKHFGEDPNAKRTEACPINGEFYTEKAKAIWEKRRPLAVMIENHTEARPQSGLSFADVVYESVAEGGISRFMGIFYCGVSTNVLLAPVRSARAYYLPWVLEYDALYNHVGGAGRCEDPTVDERAKALCQIEQYKIKDMDQFGISFPTCYRNYDRLDHTVATEHTMVCQTEKLFALAKDRGWTNVDSKGASWDKNFVSWKFKDEAKANDRGTVNTISFVAWKGYEKDYGVEWTYDANTNTYLRKNGGVAHKDLENDEQISAKAFVVMFAKEVGPVDEHMHLLYQNIGNGTGLLFQDGKAEKITWKKEDKSSRTLFFDAKGKEIQFNRGSLWIHMLPIGTPVTY